ncbi:MAG: hypothetical protein RLY70_404 [Planctomycetota bacterium]
MENLGGVPSVIRRHRHPQVKGVSAAACYLPFPPPSDLLAGGDEAAGLDSDDFESDDLDSPDLDSLDVDAALLSDSALLR